MLHRAAAPSSVVGGGAGAWAGVSDGHENGLRVVPALDEVFVVCLGGVAREGASLSVLGVWGNLLQTT